MLTSSVGGRVRRVWWVLSALGVGLLLGGCTSSLVLLLLSGLASPLPLGAVVPIVVAMGALALLRDFGIIEIALPQNARQIPRSVFDRRPASAALQFGFELGTGVRTYLPSTAPYLLAVALLFAHPTLEIALYSGLGFGLGRVMMPVGRQLGGAGDAWDALLTTRLRVLVPMLAVVTSVLAICLVIERLG